jgi:raffinose/stachyose/melibiose transport system permease protein
VNAFFTRTSFSLSALRTVLSSSDPSQICSNLPRDFDEAARLDGCNWIQVIFYVVGPLLLLVSSTVSILTGIAIWNDYFGQLIFLLGSGNETLPITIYTFSSQYSSQYHLLAAGLVLAMLPMVTAYLLLQRRIVEGFSSGIRG